MSLTSISVPVTWAISQYRQVLAVIANRTQGVRQIIKAPTESPQVRAYLQSIGIGRNIDVYA